MFVVAEMIQERRIIAEAGGEVTTDCTVSVQGKGGSWHTSRKDGLGQECVELFPGMQERQRNKLRGRLAGRFGVRRWRSFQQSIVCECQKSEEEVSGERWCEMFPLEKGVHGNIT